jgi:cobalamin biosynthesis protein CbiG
MKSAILTSESNKNLKILIELADRLGIKAKMLTDEQLEDIGLIKAIKHGRTGSFVDPDKFISGLK